MPVRRPARRLAYRAALLLALGTYLGASTGAVDPAPVAAAAEGRTIPGPGGLSVTVTPADLSTVRSGDRVHLVFRGLDKTQFVDFVGNCPSPFPVPVKDLASGPQLPLACYASFDSGLPGAVDTVTGLNLAASSQVRKLYPAKDGTVTVDYLVGSGKSTGNVAYYLFYADGRTDTVKSLTCGPADPCSIGFSVLSTVAPGQDTASWVDLSSLTVRPAPYGTVASGCSASDVATVPAVGPERGQLLLSTLNRGLCTAAPAALPVNYVATGEPSVSGVGTSADLAVAGSSLLAATDAPPPSAGRVLVPLGLSATVLAQVGAPPPQDSLYPGQKVYGQPLPPLSLRAADAARVVVHDFPSKNGLDGQPVGENTLGQDLMRLPGNDVLKGFDPSLFGLPLNAAPTVTYPTGPDSAPAALSSFLAAAAPAEWRYPASDPNRVLKRVGEQIGVTSSFDPLVDTGNKSNNTALPQLTSAASTVNSLYSAILAKDIPGQLPGALACPFRSVPDNEDKRRLAAGCVRFLVGDASTMADLRLPAAKVANASGNYVAPTPAALQAASAGAVPDDKGVLALKAPTGGAYPMTFVEYAVVPAAPLLTEDCLPRTAQQDRLRSFLTYATGPGQSALPPGMAPLTPELKALAAAAIAKVGTGPATGPCAPVATPSPAPSGGATSGGTVDAGSATGPGASGFGPDGGSSGRSDGLGTYGTPGASGTAGGSSRAAGATAPQPASAPAVAAAADRIEAAVPRFGGVPVAGGVALPLTGLALLVAALSTAGLASGGRGPSPRGVAEGALRRVAGLRRRLPLGAGAT